MPRRHSFTVALIALSVVVGCGPDPNQQPAQVVAPPPEDSGADRLPPVVVAPDKREEGHGYPDRLHAGHARVVRGDTEVRVDSTTVGDQLIVSVSVRTRGEKPLAFADWTDPKAASAINTDGQALPLIPLTAEQVKDQREKGAGRSKAGVEVGAGEVTRTRPRISVLQFDVKAVAGEHVDLDLDGAAVGFTDPIRFRIPQRMLTPAMGRP